MYTAVDLRFDADGHRSFLPDGREVPHVSAILKAVGLVTDFEDLASLSPRLGRAITTARDRGIAVHADCHAFDDADLAWETVHPEVRPYVEAWSMVRAAKGLVPLVGGRERQVYSSTFGYTGIVDGVFKQETTKRGTRVLVDLKTGDPEAAAAHIQTASYEMAWNEEHPDDVIDRRWAVWLLPTRRIPYQIIDYTDRPEAAQDFPTFLAALTVYHHQPERRRRIR